MDEKFKEQLIIKITLLIGACRQKSVKKSDIEKSLESLIAVIKAGK